MIRGTVKLVSRECALDGHNHPSRYSRVRSSAIRECRAHSCLLRSDLVKGIESNAHAETRVSIFPASRRSSGPRVSEITQPWRSFSQVACGSPDAEEIELGLAALPPPARKAFGFAAERVARTSDWPAPDPPISLLRMTLNALKLRYITKIHRMLEWLVGFMARLALAIREPAQVNRMLERSHLYCGGRIQRVIDHGVTDIAVVGDHFAVVADMLAVMTTEATRRIQMADVVEMCLPISFHLRKKIGLKDALDFSY